MSKIIDGTLISNKIKEKIKQEINKLNIKPSLAVILVGNDPASEVYVNIKKKTCKELGIVSLEYNLNENTSEEELLNLINKLNEDKNVNGILVQMPTPNQIDRKKVFNAINSLKDVDGFNPINIGKMLMDEDCLKPCTPLGVIKLLKEYDVEIESKNIVVIGKSLIVGTPLANLLLQKNATVIVCHSKTKNLSDFTIQADILISAAGKRNLITKEMVKDNVIIIDVGTNKHEGRLYGDVDFNNVKEKCLLITPVPKGVGPMTIACLMENTLKAYKIQRGLI
jgi:methylenetetrahydrofolate dehydrogenase (NADP+) / methenyltetrahydrofolate cyclohydrolase